MESLLPNSVDPRDLGARLRKAREARGWTQQQSAEELGVARTTLTAIEKGERKIRPEELTHLARLYGRKVSWLLRRGVPTEDVCVQLRDALPSDAPIEGDLQSQISELEKLVDDYVELERLRRHASHLRREPPPYPLEGAEPEALAEDIASAERNRLGLGDAPVHNLRAVLEEDLGLWIFYMDLPWRVAGMLAYTAEQGGILGINRHHRAQRRRLSMAHEYGHFLTARYRPEITLLDRYERRPAAERFAETFARAFLMPAASLRRRFHQSTRQRGQRDAGGPTIGDLCQLAHFFFVSVEAMTHRLEELQLLPSGTWDRLRQEDFRVHEAQELLGLQEHPVDDELLPSRYRYLAVEAWQRGDLSEGQLAAFLRVDRLTARRLVHEMGLSPGTDADSSCQYFLPLSATA